MQEDYSFFPPTNTWTYTYKDDSNVYVECYECKSKIRLDSNTCKHCRTDLSKVHADWRRAYAVLSKQESSIKLKQQVLIAVGSVLFCCAFVAYKLS